MTFDVICNCQMKTKILTGLLTRSQSSLYTRTLNHSFNHSYNTEVCNYGRSEQPSIINSLTHCAHVCERSVQSRLGESGEEKEKEGRYHYTNSIQLAEMRNQKGGGRGHLGSVSERIHHNLTKDVRDGRSRKGGGE